MSCRSDRAPYCTGLAVRWCSLCALVLHTMAGLTACSNESASTANDSAAFLEFVAELEERSGGRIGVYSLDTESGQSLSWRADERFAMASTFKPLLVAAVLARVDAGELALDDSYSPRGIEIQPYSPVINALTDGQSISLRQLCSAAVSLGDNTASNMLLDLIAGPAGLTQYLRDHGDTLTRLDRYEVELNANTPGDIRDTTTPQAMVQSLRRALESEDLSEDSRARLRGWMVASTTGSRRLRAGLPADWQIGDKTGTGMNGAVNNVAIGWPPDSKPLLIAVYLSESELPVGELEGLHPAIARQVVDFRH